MQKNTKGDHMRMYPNNWEIYNDSNTEMLAEFKVINEDIITIDLVSKELSVEELIQLSQCLEKAYKQYTEPDKEN